MSFKTSITINVDAQRIDDIIHCAIDGDIRYWCPRCAFGSVSDATPNTFTEDDDGKEKTHKLTQAKVKRGLTLFAKLAPKRFQRCFMGDGCEYDADDADLFLQTCLFGEVKYG